MGWLDRLLLVFEAVMTLFVIVIRIFYPFSFLFGSCFAAIRLHSDCKATTAQCGQTQANSHHDIERDPFKGTGVDGRNCSAFSNFQKSSVLLLCPSLYYIAHDTPLYIEWQSSLVCTLLNSLLTVFVLFFAFLFICLFLFLFLGFLG
ncbi:hypothetical protein CAOG_009635 [Capsaspora owczarzaki ATCC 30864]|uniref:Uncharacterized protein n=1 Tax=Capsaspora owczarzaki (strain ATCC 30864) TaxID=595528 RepID=A0A0D2UAT9_CAPO3|nr:hypothetical protein CAOG_009635 [Capsaspora owczarzaki ATCC 30864]